MSGNSFENQQNISDTPLSQTQIDAMMKARQNENFNVGGGAGGGAGGSNVQMRVQRQAGGGSGQANSLFVLYYSEKDNSSRHFMSELHKTAFFKKFIILCVDKPDIKIPRCVRSIPTIIVPTRDGPKPLAGEMAMNWLEIAKQQSVPGNEGAGGAGAGGAGAGGVSGNMQSFDKKVGYGIKAFGENDQLSSWDSAGTGGYSQGFALWDSSDKPTGLFDDNGSGINSHYTPLGLQTDQINPNGQDGSGGSGGNSARGGTRVGQAGGDSSNSGGIGSLPGTCIDTREESTVSNDFEQFMAMRDSDPYISRPTARK